MKKEEKQKLEAPAAAAQQRKMARRDANLSQIFRKEQLKALERRRLTQMTEDQIKKLMMDKPVQPRSLDGKRKRGESRGTPLPLSSGLDSDDQMTKFKKGSQFEQNEIRESMLKRVQQEVKLHEKYKETIRQARRKNLSNNELNLRL